MTNPTELEILEKLRDHFQTKVNNLSGDEMAEGPFEDPDETLETYGNRWEAAATVIGQRGGLRIRFEFGDADSTSESVAETQLRRQLEDAESAARLTKEHYIRRCERLTKARDDRQAMLNRAATLIEDSTKGLNGEGAEEEHQWLREYRAAAGLDDGTAAAAQQRTERAADEARPHDDEHAIDCQGDCEQPGKWPCSADEAPKPLPPLPFLGFTADGHPVGGPIPDDVQAPALVARCGGPAMCGACANDADDLRRAAGEAGRA